MSFFGGLALILLTLVGYSSGAVIARRRRKEPRGFFDGAIMCVTTVQGGATVRC